MKLFPLGTTCQLTTASIVSIYSYMRNKTVVKIRCIGIAASFCGGLISGFNGGNGGLSALLKLGGAINLPNYYNCCDA